MFKRIRVAKSNVPPFEALECECLAFILTDDKINDGERKKWKKFKFTKRIKQKLRKTKAACIVVDSKCYNSIFDIITIIQEAT